MTDEAIDLDELEAFAQLYKSKGHREIRLETGYVVELLRRARRLERCERFLREHGAELAQRVECSSRIGDDDRDPDCSDCELQDALAALMKEIEK